MLMGHSQGATVPSAAAAGASEQQSLCCAVCGCAGATIFCAIFSCRPCASFFRRSVKDRREYKCRANGDCPIDKVGMRNCCRACRLRRCFEAGMRLGLDPNHQTLAEPDLDNFSAHFLARPRPIKRTVGDVSANAIPTSFVCSPSASDASAFLPSFPTAHRIGQLLREFSDRQKAICAQQFGIGTVFGNKLRKITHEEYSRIERGTVVLLYNFVSAIFPQIDSVPTQEKILILKSFTCHFSVLHCCDLTIKYLPLSEAHCQQFVILPGCLFELDLFATTLTGPGKQQQMAFASNYIGRFYHFLSHIFKPLDVTPLEFAALLGIQLWKCVSECVGTTSEFGTAADPSIDTLFFELHSMVAASECGANLKRVAVRFGRILSMLTDVSVLARDMNEMFTLCKVFLDPESCVSSNDLWDEMFAERGKGPTATEKVPMESTNLNQQMPNEND